LQNKIYIKMNENKVKTGAEVVGGSVGAVENNASLICSVTTYRDCLKCKRVRQDVFYHNVVGYESMDLQRRNDKMKEYRHELALIESVTQNDLIGTLDFMIDYSNMEIEKLTQGKEVKDEVNEDEYLTAQGQDTIPLGTRKIKFNALEYEFAIKMKSLIEGKNKVGDKYFSGDKKKYAKWICDTIVLEYGKTLNFNTIYNGLSRIEIKAPQDKDDVNKKKSK